MIKQKTKFLSPFKTPLEKCAFLISTGFGVGLLKPMPGTWGTLASLPLIFLINHMSYYLQILFWIILFSASLYCISIFQKKVENHSKDAPEIVVDEILAMFFIFLFIPFNMVNIILVFFLFRFFDIVKIIPVRNIDRWSKKASTPFFQSLGVVLDDLVAALQTLGVLWLLQKTILHFSQ